MGPKYARLTHRVTPTMTKSVQATDSPQNTTDQASTDGTSAEFVLPAEEFAFGSVFESDPHARIELEPTAAGLDNYALVNITTTDCDRTVIESLLQTDPAVTDVNCIAERTEGWTYRLQWTGHARRLMQELVTEDITLLTAWGTNNQWNLRLLTSDRNTLSEVHETITDLGYSVETMSITSYDGGDADCSELSEKQQETLIRAYKTGYYDIPQDITAEELAEQLDISHQALSERLHRAYKQIVGDELSMDTTHQS
jgi:predicted DNA binding protein